MKHSIVICALVIFGATYCQAQTTNTQHVNLIHKYVESISAQDSEAMESTLHDEFVGYGPAVSDTLNKENTLSYWEDFWANQVEEITFHRAASLTHTVEEGNLMGDWVFDWFDVHITYQQDPDTPVHFRAHIAARIVDGKLKDMVSYYNIADIQQQLGFEVVPPGQQ